MERNIFTTKLYDIIAPELDKFNNKNLTLAPLNPPKVRLFSSTNAEATMRNFSLASPMAK
jgi:hypothetical protein